MVASHRQIINRLYWMWEAYPFAPGEVGCQKTALSFVDSLWELLGPLLQGFPTVIIPEEVLKDPARLVAVLAERRVTRLWLVPTFLASLLDAFPSDQEEKLPALRFWVSSGEPLPTSLLHRFQRSMPKATLFNLYGTSEVWDATWYAPARSDAERERVPIGRPISNVQVYVLDQQRQLVPIGVSGEPYVAGDGLSHGYWNRPDWTSEKFATLDFLPGETLANRTGDRVRFLPDGNLEYLGRFDEQKKIRGYRIEVEEIENVLSTFPGVRQCAVALKDDQYGQPRIVAYVVLNEKKVLDSATLRSWLQQKLPDFMVPAIFVTMEHLPLSPSGKINRRSLPDPETERRDQTALLEPRDATEQIIVKIWEQVLDRRPIGINEDFFELGGHSFLAIRLMAEIKSVTGEEIPVSALFQGSTVEHLSSVLKNGADGLSYPLVMDLRDTRQSNEYSKPPFFCVATPGVNALGYLSLSHHMDRARPVYKVQAPRKGEPAGGVGGRFYTDEEWESMEQEYCRALRFLQPQGPYYLGGMCGGARIAFEIARRLELEGETVRMLAVFDTWAEDDDTVILILASINWYFVRARQLLNLPREERQAQLRRFFRNRYDTLTSLQYEKPVHYGKPVTKPKCTVSFKSNAVLCSDAVTVFRRRKQPYYRKPDRRLGWGMRTSAHVEVVEISAPTHGVVLREPFVKDLARQLEEKFAACETITPSSH